MLWTNVIDVINLRLRMDSQDVSIAEKIRTNRQKDIIKSGTP